jgi:tungstate transport system permease protein
MDLLIDSVLSAILLLWSLDPEVYFIIYVSLKVSLSSTLIASVLGVPTGFIIAFREFRGKRVVITTLNS